VTSRRQFLTTGAAIVAGAAMPRIVRAIPLTRAAGRTTANAWLPEPPATDLFQRLALAAMDAAKVAGADFADIRIGVQRSIAVGSAELTSGYGIRARVQGTWGFQHGSVLTSDAVVAAARSATAGAARYAATNVRLGRRAAVELAPAPVVTGEWRGPVEIDPFTVPLDDYSRVTGSITETTARLWFNSIVYAPELRWQAETRVFASTEGSLVTQHFMRGGGGGNGYATLPDNPNDRVWLNLPGLEDRSAGFEAALRPDLTDYLLSGMEEIVRLRELPSRAFMDVGRFPIVFDGAAFAKLVGMTASSALDGDRVSGIEADASGTSFLVPPDEILTAAKPQFSPLLTMATNRALPSVTAVQWDDEGVAPEPYTAIKAGHVVDYHTTRESASLLAAWYQQQGRPLRSHGGAVAPTPANLPMATGGHIHVAPAASRASAADLYREMEHGFVIRGGDGDTEPGLTTGTLRGALVLEVVRGKPVARTAIDLNFATKALLGVKLVALGDSTTVGTTYVSTSKGIPWVGMNQPATAPAALCKDVDVISWTLHQ
jgi:TldD protein